MVRTGENILGISKIDNRNRITLSRKAIDHLNLQSGDYVSIELVDNSLCLFKAYYNVRRNKKYASL